MAIARNPRGNPRLRSDFMATSQRVDPSLQMASTSLGTAAEYRAPEQAIVATTIPGVAAEYRPEVPALPEAVTGETPLTPQDAIVYANSRGLTFAEMISIAMEIQDGSRWTMNRVEDYVRTRLPLHHDIIEVRDALRAANIDPSIQGDAAVPLAMNHLRALKQAEMAARIGGVSGPPQQARVATQQDLNAQRALVERQARVATQQDLNRQRSAPQPLAVASPVATPVGPALGERDIVQYMATNGFGYFEIVYILADQRMRRLRGERPSLTLRDLQSIRPDPNHRDILEIRDVLVRAGKTNDVYEAVKFLVNRGTVVSSVATPVAATPARPSQISPIRQSLQSPVSIKRPRIGAFPGFSRIAAVRASGEASLDLSDDEIVGFATINGWTFPEIVQVISQKRIRSLPISSEDLNTLNASRNPNASELDELKAFLETYGPFPTVFDAVSMVVGAENMDTPEGTAASGLTVVVDPPGEPILYYPSGSSCYPAGGVFGASGATGTSRADAARQFHAYISSTPANRRDQARVRQFQQAIGVSADGRFGQQSATRIFELTGLRLPGYQYPAQPGQPGQPPQGAADAARAFHAYIAATPAGSRDQARVRQFQQAIGASADGRFGQQSATRIFELTGLQLPGYTYSGPPGAPGQLPGQPPPPPSGPSAAELVGQGLNRGLSAIETQIREANATRRAEIEAESRRAIAEIQARNGGVVPQSGQDSQTAATLQAMLAAIQAMGSRDNTPPPPPPPPTPAAGMKPATVALIVGGGVVTLGVLGVGIWALTRSGSQQPAR